METGRNESKDIQIVCSIANSPLSAADDAKEKLSLLKQMSGGLKNAIAQVKAGNTQEIAALMAEQQSLIHSIDALNADSSPKAAESLNGTDSKALQQKELSLISDLQAELTALMRDSMEEAKTALIKIKNEKELRDIRQQMQIPSSGSLMDRRIK